MGKSTDVRPVSASLYFLPVETRVPLKFGTETLTYVTCARVSLTVMDALGNKATGWGETPLSVQWVWPSNLSYTERQATLEQLCTLLTAAWAGFDDCGHPMEIGHDFLEQALPAILHKLNAKRSGTESVPWLAALVCCSAFDIALHDAYGRLHQVPIYNTYNSNFMNRDLAYYLTPAANATVCFDGLFPQDFLVRTPNPQLLAWHLVGGLDPLEHADLCGGEPDDGYPTTLTDWIVRDDLRCLKVKLRGNDAEWDYNRLVTIGQIAILGGVLWLSADFNCTVQEPVYVTNILDKLMQKQPRIYSMILYVEQPFPYDLEAHRIDVHSVSARKPLFMDESAHDWKLIRLGRELGWTGVALKTCKTQTGAILSLCWAKAHGMTLMVQDLTNPMLALIPHALLAAHAGTIAGVETNACQFYPNASTLESSVHPGLYTRRHGYIDLHTVLGSGFGYGENIIERQLPSPIACF